MNAKRATRASKTDADEDPDEASATIAITAAEIEQIVQKTVTTAITAAATDLKELFNSKLAEVNSRITAAESRILAIEDHLSQLTPVVNQTESDTPISTTLAAELDAMRTETRESLLLSNDNEQYSRRNNLRICGIKPDEGENCRITAVKFMKNILRLADIDIADVETPHMTAGSQQSSLGQRKRPTMLIRFYDKRDYVIRSRKVLKGTHYAITEDLTSLNVKTMNRMRNNKDVRTTWSWNGNFFAILSNGKKVTVKPFQPISELLAN